MAIKWIYLPYSIIININIPKDNRLVGAARDHLNVGGVLEGGQEADSSDARAVVVQRRQEVVVAARVEQVDQAVPEVGKSYQAFYSIFLCIMKWGPYWTEN